MQDASIPASDRLIDEATSAPAAGTEERRGNERVPYPALAALVVLDEEGRRGAPITLECQDLSSGGLCAISREMITPGRRGAIQLRRSDGTTALIGVELRHCRHASGTAYLTGLSFTSLPEGLSPNDFLDDEGRMPLLDDRLKTNRGGGDD